MFPTVHGHPDIVGTRLIVFRPGRGKGSWGVTLIPTNVIPNKHM